MRAIVESGVLSESGVIGTGVDKLRWLAPVAPGDTLHVKGEVVELVPWPGGGHRGIARVRMETINQHGTIVMTQIANMLFPRRPEADPA